MAIRRAFPVNVKTPFYHFTGSPRDGVTVNGHTHLPPPTAEAVAGKVNKATTALNGNNFRNRPLPPVPVPPTSTVSASTCRNELQTPTTGGGATSAAAAVNQASQLLYEEPNLFRCLIHEQAKSLVALQVREKANLKECLKRYNLRRLAL